MTGTPANTAIWSDADVYVSTNLSATLPANTSTPFGVDWDLVGLLDGADGFEASRANDKKMHYSWGGGLVKITRKNHLEQRKFTAIENNAVTWALRNPGSTLTSVVVPTPVPVLIAFETRTGGKVERYISANYAEVEIDGNVKDNEDDLTKLPFVATIFPTSASPGVLYVRQAVPDIASIAITPLTLALSLAGANVKPLVATATYTDASTGVITSQATWLTSAAAKATVAYGYVTGVTTGTANITCTYGGVTSTAPCVVTVSA